MTQNVLWYSQLGMKDVEIVGGKNASLGEMIANLAKSGVKVPNGFATTADTSMRSLPAIIRLMSSRSSTSRVCRRTLRSMTSRP